MSKQQSNKKSDLGAAWKKDGQYGPYYTGQLKIDELKAAIANAEERGAKAVSVTINVVTKKTSDKQPDLRIKEYAPKPRTAAPTSDGGFDSPTDEDIPF